MGYVVLAVLLILSYLVLGKLSAFTGLSTRHLVIGWSLKLSFALAYAMIFMHFYGNGEPDLDLFNFFNDSRELHKYAIRNPGGYLQLMFGFGADDKELLRSELIGTFIWDYPAYGDLLNDNRLLIRFNSLIHFISFNNVYVHIFIMCFVSWIGLLLICKAFISFVAKPVYLFYFLAGFPSIAFWTSGLTKEALMCLSLGLYFTALFRLVAKVKPTAVLLLLVSLAMLIYNKPHVGLVVVPCSLLFVAGAISSWKKWLIPVWPSAIFLGAVMLSYAPEKFNIVSRTTQKQNDLINMAGGGVFFINDTAFCAIPYEQYERFEQHSKYSIEVIEPVDGEYHLFGDYHYYPIHIEPDTIRYDLYLVQEPAQSYIPLTKIRYSGWQLISNIPEALMNVFLRPLPNDPGSAMKYPAFLSNSLLVIFVMWILFSMSAPGRQQLFLIVALLCASMVIALVIGWTTPILGSVVRYKCAVDLLIILSMFVLWKPKIQN